MNRFELNRFLEEFAGVVEKSSNKIMAEAEELNKCYKTKKEISKLEEELRREFISIGVLSYELYKMNKNFSFEDFGEKFSKIENIKNRLKNIKIGKEDSVVYFQRNEKDQKQVQISDEDEDFEELDQIDFYEYQRQKENDDPVVVCNNCGSTNSQYVVYCSKCGKKL